MGVIDHNKIIKKVATEILNSYGIYRKGQSRTYIDDNGWFINVIEFQPSRWDKGSYLNIGINFNWYLQEYFSFDIGYRESYFTKFIDEKQFTEYINDLCVKSIKKLTEYRNNLKNLKEAEKLILKHNFTSDNFWGNYHKGIISGLVYNINNLNKYFSKILNENDENIGWRIELKNKTNELRKIANDDINKFREKIIDLIKDTRKLKKLDENVVIIL